jgi:hydroxycarboxylate dehydrogenase B
MIPSYLRNLEGSKVTPNEPGHIASDTGALVVYEGARGYGQIVARNATELAIERAKANGVRSSR